MKAINCKVKLKGVMESEFEFSHSVYGEKFYTGKISVKRSSGEFDSIPVVVSNNIVENINEIKIGTSVSILGELRTYNLRNENKRLLKVFAFAQELNFLDEPCFLNEVYIDGYVCKTPIYRKTPLGREITDLVIAVNRPYKKSDYIPCICWGRNAIYSARLEIGNRIVAIGRMQSRKYKKIIGEDTVEKETYELSISSISKVENE